MSYDDNIKQYTFFNMLLRISKSLLIIFIAFSTHN